ncbi:MAG TPA: hypothetical protein VLC12_10010 [Terriglobales bacterium]|nr:hypothetical protein [Terriglobales bacterium]
MRKFGIVVSVVVLTAGLAAQQAKPPKSRVKKTNPTPTTTTQTESTPAATPQPSAQPALPAPGAAAAGKESKELHFDVSEAAPVVTHQQVTVNGRALRYTATTGRLPIKREDGKIEGEMFFVAYTLDGENAAQRPLTFAFNGGPGSASVWLHMGALGPRRVVLQPGGFMPASPYHLQDNQYSQLDRSDLVLVDAMATGWSRAEDEATTKKFLGGAGRPGRVRRIHPAVHHALRALGVAPVPVWRKLRNDAGGGPGGLPGGTRHLVQRDRVALHGDGFLHPGVPEKQ